MHHCTTRTTLATRRVQEDHLMALLETTDEYIVVDHAGVPWIEGSMLKLDDLEQSY
jgi:hypothetical protein